MRSLVPLASSLLVRWVLERRLRQHDRAAGDRTAGSRQPDGDVRANARRCSLLHRIALTEIGLGSEWRGTSGDEERDDGGEQENPGRSLGRARKIPIEAIDPQHDPVSAFSLNVILEGLDDGRRPMVRDGESPAEVHPPTRRSGCFRSPSDGAIVSETGTSWSRKNGSGTDRPFQVDRC